MKGAMILTVCGVVGKLLGALYRIPLTNILGAEGIGLYQIVFPVYSLLLTMSSTGLPTAISRLIAEKRALGDFDGAHDVHRVTFRSLLLSGLLVGTAVFLLSDVLARLQGNALAGLAYKGIAPAIIFVSVISSYRGFFQGRRNMTPSALSQLTEQAVKMAVGLVLARLLLRYGLEYGVFGAVLGVSVSELVAMVSLMIVKTRNRDPLSKDYVPPKSFSVLKSLYKVALPITLGGLILPLTQMIDSVMVINILKRTTEAGQATALYGLSTGPVSSLINMPAVISLSIGAASLPVISHLRQKGDTAAVAREIGGVVKLTMILTLPCFMGMFLFSEPIIRLLYGRSLSTAEIAVASQMLRMASVGVLYLSILQVFTAVIQGAGKSMVPVINLLIGAVAKVALTAILLRPLGILGSVAATTTCYMVTAVLNSAYLSKRLSAAPALRDFALPFVASVLTCGLAYLVRYALATRIGGTKALIVAVCSAVAVYAPILAAFRVINLNTFFRGLIRGKSARQRLINKL